MYKRQQVITVNKIAQAALVLANQSNISVGDLTLFTAGGSGSGAVTYSVASAGTAGCSIAGDQLTAAQNGTCQVVAAKAA